VALGPGGFAVGAVCVRARGGCVTGLVAGVCRVGSGPGWFRASAESGRKDSATLRVCNEACGVSGGVIRRRVLFWVSVERVEGFVMSRRRLAIDLSGRELETVLEALRQAAVKAVDAGRIRVDEASGGLMPAELAELDRLSRGFVAAYAAAAPQETILALVARAGRGSESPVLAKVGGGDMWAGLPRVSVPVQVWECLREAVSQAEGMLRAPVVKSAALSLGVTGWFASVEGLRSLWGEVAEAAAVPDAGRETSRDICGGCGLGFDREVTAPSGSLCPACVAEAGRGDRA
jgi:hypothetical protein